MDRDLAKLMEDRLLIAFRKLPLADQERKLWLMEYSAASCSDTQVESDTLTLETDRCCV